MDQKKIGVFLKELRTAKNITQEQLAEILRVHNRTVSRWETGHTMPDFDLMVELSKFYDVTIEELLNGERKIRGKESLELPLEKIAEYTNAEKAKHLKKHYFFAWVGVCAWIVFLGLKIAGLDETGFTEKLASFAAGLAFSATIISLIYSRRNLKALR